MTISFLERLRRFLKLENGIPSHDTLGYVFARLDPRAFEHCFASWVQEVFERTEGAIIPIDGKTLRRSYDRTSNRAAIAMVSAWALENHLVLGQVKVTDESNEIQAIPRLLELLDGSGCIVTIDAMGCQQEIAARIVEHGGDYVLAVKGNQGQLLEEAQKSFLIALGEAGSSMSYFETEERGHGRLERRCYWMTEGLPNPLRSLQWKGLKSFGMVESERVIKGKTSLEQRFYISSLASDARRFAEAVRGHWSIENQVHWVLDVAFSEDQSRIRKDHVAENMAVVRRLALNLLKQEKSMRVGIANKRLKAAWDEAYLLKVLQLK